jgi:propionate CoA-transferase
VYCLATFTSGPQTLEINNNQLTIIENGPIKKFLAAVEQITFNGQYAIEKQQNVMFITERAVFKLTEKGLKLLEIAPGVNLKTDILDHMEFTPIIDDDYVLMDPRLFNDGPMNLQHVGSMPMPHMRSVWKRMLESSSQDHEFSQ